MTMMTTEMTKQAHALLYLEAEEPEPEPLYAFLYFLNGKRLQIVGQNGEIATFNLSNTEHYAYLFCCFLAALRYEHGNIRIREEHLAHLPPCFHPYFEPHCLKDGEPAPQEQQAGGDER
jgi:hypothetical protein